MRRRKQDPERRPYCPPNDHTYVQVVAGKGYSDDYDTKVCIYCHSHLGVRKAKPPHPADCHAPCCDLGGYLM